MVASFGVALAAAEARADVTPPPDDSERCTLEDQSPGMEACEACEASGDDPTTCAASMAGKSARVETPFRFRCKSWGVFSWTEIWCRSPKGEALASTATPEDRSTTPTKPGCDLSAGTPSGRGWEVALAVLGAALMVRRRSREGALW